MPNGYTCRRLWLCASAVGATLLASIKATLASTLATALRAALATAVSATVSALAAFVPSLAASRRLQRSSPPSGWREILLHLRPWVLSKRFG